MQIIENGFSEESIKSLKIINKVLALTRGYLFRKKHEIKIVELKNNNIEKFNTFIKIKNNPNILKAESRVLPYDKYGWHKYYSDNLQFHYKFKNRLFHDHLLVYCNNYYYGSIDIYYKKCGFGILVKKSGTKYEGFWMNDQFTGWGRYIDIEGNLFEGLFEKGLLNGKGEKHSITGSVYIGNFVKGVKEGIGKEETNEHIYVGEFKKDKKNGTGRLTYKKINESYEGEFNDNSITGKGCYTWANSDHYEGMFLDGKMHGWGVYKWPDGGYYEGGYVHGIKEGIGVFKWVCGKTFEGPFKKGKPHGSGKLNVKGISNNVQFEDGKMIINKKELYRINTNTSN
jgi:hypothetical protein